MQSCEYLSDDILDECFVKCFFPIHIVQLFLGSNRADIRDGFVTRSTNCQKLYAVLWILPTFFSFTYYEYFYYKSYYAKSPPLYIGLAIGAILQYSAYISNLIRVKFFDGEESSKMYLMLQRIDRTLKLDNLPNINQKQYVSTLFVTIFATVSYLVGYLVHVVFVFDRPGICMIMGIGLIVVFMESILTCSMIYYLGLRFKLLNEMIKYNIILKKANNLPGVDHSWTLKDSYRIVVDSAECRKKKALGLETFLMSLKNILKAFHKVSELFRFSVLTVVMTVFFWAFFIIQAMVIGSRSNVFPLIGVITMCLWIVFYFLVLVLLSVTIDWFAKQAKHCKSLCIFALSIYHDGPIFLAAKDFMRLLDLDKPVFSVYGIFVLDTSFPLKLLGLISNNVLITLPFLL